MVARSPETFRDEDLFEVSVGREVVKIDQAAARFRFRNPSGGAEGIALVQGTL